MTSSRYKQRLRFWPMVAVMYILLCGGPYGIEEIVPQSGPTLAVFGMIFMAIFWGLPNILQTAELASALPLQVEPIAGIGKAGADSGAFNSAGWSGWPGCLTPPFIPHWWRHILPISSGRRQDQWLSG